MPSVVLYNQNGRKLGTLDLSDAVFGVEYNNYPQAYSPPTKYIIYYIIYFRRGVCNE